MQRRTAASYQESALVLRISGPAGISREHELLRHDRDTQTYFRVLHLAPKVRGFAQAHECFAEKEEVMDWYCLDCRQIGPLDKRGRCATCDSNAVAESEGRFEWTRIKPNLKGGQLLNFSAISARPDLSQRNITAMRRCSNLTCLNCRSGNMFSRGQNG